MGGFGRGDNIRFRIAQRMMLAVVISGAMLTLLWVSRLFWFFNLEVESRKQSLIHAAEAIMNAADSEVARHSTAVSTMAASYTAEPTSLALLEKQAIAAAQTMGDAWLLLARQNGQQVFNTRTPIDAPLPVRGPVALAAQKNACETGQPLASGIGIGPIAQLHHHSVASCGSSNPP